MQTKWAGIKGTFEKLLPWLSTLSLYTELLWDSEIDIYPNARIWHYNTFRICNPMCVYVCFTHIHPNKLAQLYNPETEHITEGKF